MSAWIDPALVAAAGLAGSIFVAGARCLDQRRRDVDGREYRVVLPRRADHKMIRAFLATLSGLSSAASPLSGRDSAVFEARGRKGRITLHLRLPKAAASYYVAQLRAAVPAISIVEVSPTERAAAGITRGRALVLRRGRLGLAAADPGALARTILAAHTGTKGEDVTLWQVVVGGGQPAAPSVSPGWGVRGVVSRLRYGTKETVPSIRPDQGLVGITVRLGVRASSRRRERVLLSRLQRAAAAVSSPDSHFVARVTPGRLVAGHLRRGATVIVGPRSFVTLDELEGIIAWPVDTWLAGYQVGTSPQLPVPEGVLRKGRPLGVSTVTRQKVAQGVRAATEHTLIAGPSGSGKTWLQIATVLDDAAHGRGGVVIVPKESTAELLLERWPESAIERTIYLNPLDTERPVTFPFLAHETARTGITELPGEAVMELLRHQNRDPLGPRSSDILMSSLYALSYVPGSTLFDLLRLWTDPRYRARVAGHVAGDPVQAQFFAWLDGLGDAERNLILAAPSNKVRPLLQRPITRNILAAPRASFTMSQAMASNLTVIVSLPEGALGSAATNLLAGVIIARTFTAAQNRRAGSKPWFLTIDEAPRFLGTQTDLGDILARSREFGVGATLITQSLGQFPTDLRSIAINSCRTLVAFGTKSDDSRRLADALGPMVTPDMINGLARFEAIATVGLGGAASDPFTFRTTDIGEPIKGRAEAVKRASRERWGIDRAEIEATFHHEPTGPNHAPRQVGRRPKP